MPKVYKLRVLLDTEETIFRDIEIGENLTFLDFHLQILKAFQFENSQMASFYMSNDNWDKGQEITLMKMDFDDGSSSVEMQDTVINDFLDERGQKLVYVFDFLVMWCFFIELVDIRMATDEKDMQPKTVNEFGKAPKQNSKQVGYTPADDSLMLQNKNPKKKSPKDNIFDGFDDFEQDSFFSDSGDDDDDGFVTKSVKKDADDDDLFGDLSDPTDEDFGVDKYDDED